MKFQTLPIKRRPASKGIFRRLSAVTRGRKQRVSATASAAELEDDDGGSIVSRALIIIFLFHIVVIGLIFIHQHFLDGRPAESSQVAKTGTAEVTTTAAAPTAEAQGQASGREPMVAKAGDSYASIAAAKGVDEDALRLLNKHVNIGSGSIIQLPPPRVATTTPIAVTATPPDRDRGLVETAPVDVSGAPKAHLVRANGARETPPARATATPLAATGKAYVVQQGDSIWRIAHRSKVSQDALLRANGISDARKIKPGMKLIIPHG